LEAGKMAKMTALEAQEVVRAVGQGVARQLYADTFWRNSAIDGLVQAAEVLGGDPLWLCLAYLNALRDYGRGESEFGLKVPAAQLRFARAETVPAAR